MHEEKSWRVVLPLIALLFLILIPGDIGTCTEVIPYLHTPHLGGTVMSSLHIQIFAMIEYLQTKFEIHLLRGNGIILTRFVQLHESRQDY